MTATGSSYDFVYVHSDIPEGMTIRAWRTQRAADDVARRTAARAARRRRRRQRMQEWLDRSRVRLSRLRLTSREAVQ